jgi:hypothetical protein
MNKFNLEIIGTPTEFGNINHLNNYKFYNNRRFPESYKNFVTEYGYGVSLGQFHIYIPMDDYGDSWNIRSVEMKSTYYEDVENGDIWFDLTPDGDIDLIKRLIPFASSDNGYYLFWDPESGCFDEFDTYITDFRGMGFTKIGETLYDVFETLTIPTLAKSKLPFLTEPLPCVFKCLKKQ